MAKPPSVGALRRLLTSPTFGEVKMATEFKPCSVDGCNGDARSKARGAKGLCSAHYQRSAKWGDPLILKRHKIKQKCSVPECPNILSSNGLCRKHDQRRLRHGDPLHETKMER